MKTIGRILILMLLSLMVMITVDYMIGAEAEFLNAYSVVQRLLGQVPMAGDSLLAREYGVTGELVFGLGANFLIGCLLTLMLKLAGKH